MTTTRSVGGLQMLAGIVLSGFSRLAVVACNFVAGSTSTRILQRTLACVALLFAAGLRVQAAPVTNADVARLLAAGVSEQVIVQTIQVGQPVFDLSPDALIALKNQGATQAILSAMLATAQPAASAPTDYDLNEPPSVEPSQVSLNYFQGQLAPYGNWIQLPGYGWCWQPAAVSRDSLWRPYCDAGHWVYTDQGWFWASDYPWGDVVFHYGRWARQPGYGWIWVPDYTWAPSWVAWRQDQGDGYVGWAPLPPAARFVAGVGFSWGGRVVVDADFGLRASDFCFIGWDHYWDHNFRAYLLRSDRAEFIWRRSVIRNGYRFSNGRFIIDGIGAQRVAVFTRHEVHPIGVREFARVEQHEHFVARRNEVVRQVEVRREMLRREPNRPGQVQHPEVRREEINRGGPVPQRYENGHPQPGTRVEPGRPGAVNRGQPAIHPKTPPKGKPAPKPAPKREEQKDQNAK
jgi:hypothetical protein